jgi:hypothetical protein
MLAIMKMAPLPAAGADWRVGLIRILLTFPGDTSLDDWMACQMLAVAG